MRRIFTLNSAYIQEKATLLLEKCMQLLQPTKSAFLLPYTQHRPLQIPVYTRREGQLRFIDEKKFFEIFGVQYLPTLKFENGSIYLRVQKLLKNAGKSPQVAMQNKWIHALFKRQFETASIPLGAIKWIDHELGYGVFAYKDIPQYSFIGEYSGIVRKKKWKKDAYNNYLFRYSSFQKELPFIIDAEKEGGFARFINHSDTPNLTSRSILIDGISRIFLFANAPIQKGTQLTYDYGEHYWRSRRLPKEI